MSKKPEDKAREDIDRMLEKAGWDVQDIDHINIDARQGIAISDFPLKPGHGFADYILYIDGKAAGVIEAKKAGTTLTGVEIQSEIEQRLSLTEEIETSIEMNLKRVECLRQSILKKAFSGYLLTQSLSYSKQGVE